MIFPKYKSSKKNNVHNVYDQSILKHSRNYYSTLSSLTSPTISNRRTQLKNTYEGLIIGENENLVTIEVYHSDDSTSTEKLPMKLFRETGFKGSLLGFYIEIKLLLIDGEPEVKVSRKLNVHKKVENNDNQDTLDEFAFLEECD